MAQMQKKLRNPLPSGSPRERLRSDWAASSSFSLVPVVLGTSRQPAGLALVERTEMKSRAVLAGAEIPGKGKHE